MRLMGTLDSRVFPMWVVDWFGMGLLVEESHRPGQGLLTGSLCYGREGGTRGGELMGRVSRGCAGARRTKGIGLGRHGWLGWQTPNSLTSDTGKKGRDTGGSWAPGVSRR